MPAPDLSSIVRSLRARILLVFVAGLLPLAGYAIWRTGQAAEDNRRDGEAALLGVARQVAFHTHDVVEGGRVLLHALSISEAVRSKDPARCRDFLSEVARSGGFSAVAAADEEGHIRCSSVATSGNLNVADRLYFKEAMATGRFTVGEFVHGRGTGRAAIHLAEPILRADGIPIGVVFGAVPTETLQKLVIDRGLPESVTVAVGDRNGTIIARQPDSQRVGERLSPERVARLKANLRRVVGPVDGVDGVPRYYAALEVPGVGQDKLYVTAGIDATAFGAVARRELKLALIALLVVGLIALGLAWWFGDIFIVQRAQLIAETAKRIGDGDFAARTGMQTQDGELDRVGAALDDMAQALARQRLDRERTQARLAASESNYKRFFHGNPMPLLVCDKASFEILAVNDALCEHYGYGARDLIGKGISVLVVPQQLERLAQMPKVSGLVRSSGWLHRTADGRVIEIETVGHDIEFEGRAARLISPQDVTERNATEAEIRRLNADLEARVAERTRELEHANALQRTFFDNAPQIVWICDPEGGLQYVNRHWTEFVGGTVDDWLGHGYESALHPEDRVRYLAERADRRVDGKSFQMELRLRSQTGEYGHFVNYGSPVFNEAGELFGWVGMAIDVTERLRVEQALRDSNRELEAFSYSVSHDLRSPLHAIDGFSNALLVDHASQLDVEAQRYLQRIRQGAQRMAELIEDLLQLARVSRVQMVPGPVDLSDEAQGVIAQLRAGDPKREVAVTIQPGMHARGDRLLLHQVLENLLGNAWKFTAHTAEARIEVSTFDADGVTGFRVRDNGAGFDMRYADKLFGVFQRLHTAEQFPGTGVGLATVQRIVHRHGGRVWAHAEPGSGAEFSFVLQTEPVEQRSKA
ncbi:hypothetical protein BWI17_17740 [Betaproteobacteria bacterium GR16-43]|nr:hypothetical protein BWI17_17740 [Betaproteobacteria bacterium GR16-43]